MTTFVSDPRLDYNEFMDRLDFIRIYARCWNQLSFEPLEPFLEKNVRYTSQISFEPVEGKEDVIRHLAERVADAKSDLIAKDVYAEIGFCGNEDDQPVRLFGSEGEPCVLIFRGNKEVPIGLTMLEIDDDNRLITGINVCNVVPNPRRAIRTGEYPE